MRIFFSLQGKLKMGTSLLKHKIMEINMKNKTSTFIALVLAGVLCTFCLSSCGGNNTDGNNEKDSTPNSTEKAPASPSEIMSEVVDDITPDPKNGRTVDENSDEYTADEKDGNGFMSDMFGGK